MIYLPLGKLFLFFLLLGGMSYAKYIESYIAKLSYNDHYSSRGNKLKKYYSIIRQDRANYHRFKKRDPEDTSDNVFKSSKMRTYIPVYAKKSNISSNLKYEIEHGTPTIKVEIYNDHLNITKVNTDSNNNTTNNQSSDYIGTYVAKISKHDHINSHGNKLKKYYSIIRQDRANFYKYNKRDLEDESDPIFSKKKMRALIPNILKRSYIDSSVKHKIENGFPIVKIDIYTNRMSIELVNKCSNTFYSKTTKAMIDSVIKKEIYEINNNFVHIPTKGFSSPFLEKGHDDSVDNVVIYHNYILSASSDGSVKFWSKKNFKLLYKAPMDNLLIDGKKVSSIFKNKVEKFTDILPYNGKKEFHIGKYIVIRNSDNTHYIFNRERRLLKTIDARNAIPKFLAIERSNNITNVICGTNIEGYADEMLNNKLYEVNYLDHYNTGSGITVDDPLRKKCFSGLVANISMDSDDNIIVYGWPARGEIKVFSKKDGAELKYISPNDFDDEERDSMAGSPGLSGEIKPQSAINSDLLVVAGVKARVFDLKNGKLKSILNKKGKVIGISENYMAIGSSSHGEITIYKYTEEKNFEPIETKKICFDNFLTKINIYKNYLIYSCVVDKSSDWTSQGKGSVSIYDIKEKKTNKTFKHFYASDYLSETPIQPFQIMKNKLLLFSKQTLEMFDLDNFETKWRYKVNHPVFDLTIDDTNIYLLSRIADDHNNIRYVEKLDWNESRVWFNDLITYQEYRKLPFNYSEKKNYVKAITKNEIILFNSSKEPMVTFNFFNNNDWLTITPEGYFTGSKGAARHLNITRYTDHGMEPFDFSQLYDHFFRPDLVKLKLSGDEEAYQKAIAGMSYEEALKNPPPKLAFKTVEGNRVETKGFAYVPVETKKEKVKLTFSVKEYDGGGVGLIRIYQEGKLIQTIGDGKVNKQAANLDAIIEQEKIDSKIKQNQKQYIASLSKAVSQDVNLSVEETIASATQDETTNKEGNYTVELELKAGNNDISIEAFNKTNTVTSYRENITINADIPKQKPKLYAIVAGVNEFEAPSVDNLQYSENDAKSIKEAIEKHAKGLYKDVEVHYLTGKEVTKANLLKTAQEIKRKAKLTDTVLFYISTHGRAVRGKLYLVPHNNKSVKDWIDFEQLFQAIQSVKSLNQIFIVDACESGKANDIVSSVYDSRASVLAKSSGVHVLLATTKGTSAFESNDPNVKHSVFTANLLQALNDKTTDTNNDDTITIVELSKKLKEMQNTTDYQYPVIRNVGKDVGLKRVAN